MPNQKWMRERGRLSHGVDYLTMLTHITTPHGSAGGKAAAPILRAIAERAYYTNPTYCKQCGIVIPLKAGTKIQRTKKRKFCSWHCVAMFHRQSERRDKLLPITTICNLCNSPFSHIKRHSSATRRYCPTCGPKAATLNRGAMLFDDSVTIAEVFERAASWQSARSKIQRHARDSFLSSGRPLACQVCGYEKHVEIAHRIPVSKHDKSHLLRTVNNQSNLFALCPTHHWEYDNGLLIL